MKRFFFLRTIDNHGGTLFYWLTSLSITPVIFVMLWSGHFAKSESKAFTLGVGSSPKASINSVGSVSHKTEKQ